MNSPRAHATQLLRDIRPFITDWMDRNGVPKEHRKLVLRHVSNAVAKSLAGRKK